MSQPPVRPDGDLRDFPKMLIDRRRLFASEFHAKAGDSEWRAGVTLWLKSWDQVPAGSLPNDDVELCRLAELGRDFKTWRKLKPMALHNWELADDGRLYHNTVTEVTNEALDRKERQRARTANATAASAASRRNAYRNGQRNGLFDANVTSDVTDNVTSTKGKGKGREVEEAAKAKPQEFLLTNKTLETETQPATARENGAAEESFFKNGKGNSAGRSAPLPAAPALKAKKKELLRNKLLRYADAKFSGAERSAAFAGLSGADTEHSEQWWLDHLDIRMRADHWDDTR